jgi:hypothetical protein
MSERLAPVREPFQGEIEFFLNNPDVPAMATEDDAVIFNPFVEISKEDRSALHLNESVRIFLRQQRLDPRFSLTRDQSDRFSSYSNDPRDQRATIIARMLSGDPSSGYPTFEQLMAADSVRKRYME